MSPAFRWIDWNVEHATRHGCKISEIESAVRHPVRGYPRKIGDGKWLAEGRGLGGRMIRVVYLIGTDGRAFVIHAMPLTTRRRR